MIRKINFLLALLIFFNTKLSAQGGYPSAYYSIIFQNVNDYQFQIVSNFNFGSGSTCPDLYSTPNTISTDTVYIKSLYNISGAWPSFFCVATDTVNFTNIYPTANYINISTGYYYEQLGNPGVYDTIWSVHDSTFIINPLSTVSSKNTPQLTIYPNPTTNTLHIITSNKPTTTQPIEIFSTHGQILHSSQISNLQPQISINVSHFPKGLYYLKYQGSTHKITIQ